MKKLSQGTLYLIQETVLFLVFIFLILVASTHDGLVNPVVLAWSAGFFTLAALFFLVWGQRGRSGMELPVGVFLGVLLVATFFSIDPRRSIIEVCLVTAAFMLFFLVYEAVQRGVPAELILKVLLIGVSIVMLFSWMDVVNWYSSWLAAEPGQWIPRLTYRLPIPNFLAVLMNMSLMVAIARLIRTRGWAGRIFLGLFCLSAVALLYLTSSRGGWLGTAAGLGILVLGTFFEQREKWFSAWRWLWQRKGLLIGLAVVVVLVGLAGLWLLYLQTIHPTHGSITEARKEFWIPAWAMFSSSPLVGTGPYTFISQYVRTWSVPPRNLFVYAHSLYLDVLSGSGLLGFGGFVFLVFVLLRRLIGEFRKHMGSPGVQYSLGALAVLAAFFVQGTVDSVHHVIPTSLWVLCIILGTAFTPGEKPASSIRRRISLPGLVCLGLAGLGWLNAWMAVPYQQGVTAANQGNWTGAKQMLEIAVQRDPAMAVAHQQLALAYAVLAQDDPVYLDSAIAEMQVTIKLDPAWALHYAQLSALYRAKGDLAKAELASSWAVTLAKDAPLYLLNRGEILEEMGRDVEAKATYTHLLELEPELADSPYWQESALRDELVRDWLAVNPEGEETLDQEDYPALKREYIPLINDSLSKNDLSKTKSLLILARLSWTIRSSEDVEINWLNAEYLYLLGDIDNAVSLGKSTLDSWTYQGAFGPGAYGSMPYAQYMYRRPAMGMELVPQMDLLPMSEKWINRKYELNQWSQE